MAFSVLLSLSEMGFLDVSGHSEHLYMLPTFLRRGRWDMAKKGQKVKMTVLPLVHNVPKVWAFISLRSMGGFGTLVWQESYKLVKKGFVLDVWNVK